MRPLAARRMAVAAAAAAAFAGLGAGPSGPVAQAATHPAELRSNAPVSVVASGLNGPRGLVWGPHGHLLVGEAGTVPSLCDTSDPAAVNCFGLTGSIADVSSGTPVRIRTGLASLLNGGEMVGPDDLEYVNGHLYALEPASPEFVPADLPGLTPELGATLRTQYGALLDVTGRTPKALANPGDVDYQWAPDHDGNPYALAANPRGGFYLVDGGSNTLDSIDRNGNVQVLALVPNTPGGANSVPTCLDIGPDGAVYIGELTGFGGSATDANIYRYAPRTGALTVWQSGFSAINGCGFGANGDFYVTEFDTIGFPSPDIPPTGAVIQIGRDGKRTTLGGDKLFAPAGFLAGRDGSIYVSNYSSMWPFGDPTYSTSGQVVKIG
ncbi:ScyD/ScyE family protein [Actinacidiphila bryophytorum]|uniref:ScyD/ScyE family protein n=1 Tax=Actinacidiphila bryophytorum TaxID=1436133 RepID=UPI002176B6C3|nr:ScyD/ScyE family protein [Actinacidiphila bryophytorum]UWE13284.1 ScyD/ScyE family protein [Actinacidiphila bryophytorum]